MNRYGFYQNARDAAWQVLIDYNVQFLPVDLVQIALSAEISLIKSSEVCELKSNEIGASILDGDRWYIVYDDSVLMERIRFTIAHEMGHIFLGHPLKKGYHARTIDSARSDAERQADTFASRLLCPSCVLWGLNLRTPEDIAHICNVSLSAARIRAERMQVLYDRGKFLTSPLERKVYENFKEFIKNNRI